MKNKSFPESLLTKDCQETYKDGTLKESALKAIEKKFFDLFPEFGSYQEAKMFYITRHLASNLGGW